MHIISAADFPLFCSKMSFSAGRMHASKIAYSARNSAGRICPNLVCVCVCAPYCARVCQKSPHIRYSWIRELFTSAEREVKDSWRSGLYQSRHFWDKIGHVKSVGLQFYSAIWRSESRISSRCLEITSISLIYSLTYSRKKELLFWLSRGLSRLTSVARQIRGDSKLKD